MPKGNEITLGYVHDWHRVERRNAAISVPEIILCHHATPLNRKNCTNRYLNYTNTKLLTCILSKMGVQCKIGYCIFPYSRQLVLVR